MIVNGRVFCVIYSVYVKYLFVQYKNDVQL